MQNNRNIINESSDHNPENSHLLSETNSLIRTKCIKKTISLLGLNGWSQSSFVVKCQTCTILVLKSTIPMNIIRKL